MRATGIPSIRPVESRIEASTNTSARPSSAATSSDARAAHLGAARQRERVDESLHFAPRRTIADQDETELGVLRGEFRHGLQQKAMSLPRFERPDAKDLCRCAGARVRTEAFDIDATVHDVNPCFRIPAPYQRGVVFGHGHDECRIAELVVQDGRPAVEVVGVGREAEGHARQARHDPGRGRGMVGEVGVDMPDPARPPSSRSARP
jgi:hypothetical protein